MSELLVTILRLDYLALLWIFVLGTMSVLRRDIYGTRIFARGSVHPPKSAATPPRQQPRQRGVPPPTPVTGGPTAGTTMAPGSTPLPVGRGPACTRQLRPSYASTR